MADDHYQILGVESDADITQIKRRYRQLVRRHHPDAVPTAQRDQAHNRTLAINQAWTTLSDPASRARYDVSQRKTPSFVIHPPQNQTNFSTSSTRSSATATATATAARAATTARPSTSAQTVKPGRRNGEAPPNRSRLLTQVFEAAELYFFYRKAGEAIGLCRRVLAQDANNAEAHALLGDIYADQGRSDTAIFHLERAMQSQPNNTLYRQKWAALSNHKADFPSAKTQGAHFAQANFHVQDAPKNASSENASGKNASSERARPTSSTRSVASPRAVASLGAVLRVACGFALGLLALMFVVGGHWWTDAATFYWAPAAPISTHMLLSAALGAFSLGASLTLLGNAERFGIVSERQLPVEGAPTAVLVAVAAIAFMPLGITFAFLISLSTRRANRSLFLFLTLAVLLSAVLAFPARDVTVFDVTKVPTLGDALTWWSGRAIFPALLFGWALGSLWPRK